MEMVLKIDVDESTARVYKDFNNEDKEHFLGQVSALLQKATDKKRSQRIRKIIREIRKDSGGPEVNSEILYELFRSETD